jgi:hypothetical protein
MYRNRTRYSHTAAIAAIALSLAGCASAPELRTEINPGATVSMSMENVALNAPASFGSVMLCVSSPGTATVRSVAVHQATGDIEVEAFATPPNPFTRGLEGLGNSPSTIANLHLDFDVAAPAIVTGVCPADPASPAPSAAAQLMELAVQVARRSGDAAGGPALD